MTGRLREGDDMVLAQSLGEYGGASGRAIAGLVESGLRAFSTVVDTVRHAEPTTWLGVGAALLVIWFVLRR